MKSAFLVSVLIALAGLAFGAGAAQTFAVLGDGLSTANAKETWWGVLAEMTGMKRSTADAGRSAVRDVIFVCAEAEDLRAFRPGLSARLADVRRTSPAAKVYFLLDSMQPAEIVAAAREICGQAGVALIELKGVARQLGRPTSVGLRTIAAQVSNRLAADGVIGALGPAIPQAELRESTSLRGKCAAYFVDDTIWCLRDIARTRPKSIFDQPYLRHLKEAHDRWGLKVQLNLFYRTDTFYAGPEFTLADMPDAYRAEFQATKDWLRFGPHAWQEFPDYPLLNVDYADMKALIERIRGEVERFAGPGTFVRAMVAHWNGVSTEGCRAIADCGIRLIAATKGPRAAYDGNPSSLPYGHSFRLENNRKTSTALYRRGGPNVAIDASVCGHDHMTPVQAEATSGNFKWWYDPETGLGVKEVRNGPMLNLYSVADVAKEMKKVTDRPFVCFGMHEQYFYPDYLAYQEDYVDKVFTAAKAVHDAGYRFVFVEECAE